MDGELAPAVAAAVQQHVDCCERCSRELAAFQQLGDLARRQAHRSSPTMAWELLAERLDQGPMSQAAVSASSSAELDGAQPAAIAVNSLKKRSTQNWRLLSGVLLSVVAATLLIVSWRLITDKADSHVHQPGVAMMNLQPVLEAFSVDPHLALSQLSHQFTSQEVAVEQTDAGMGHATYINSAASRNALPGDAKIASTTILSFPFCQCSPDQCSCGPHGCNCVACVCQRPDGSTYLVLEHCKSQTFSFGDLPVQLVSRDGHQLQQVMLNGAQTISFDRPTGTVTVVGLRSNAEVDTLLASN